MSPANAVPNPNEPADAEVKKELQRLVSEYGAIFNEAIKGMGFYDINDSKTVEKVESLDMTIVEALEKFFDIFPFNSEWTKITYESESTSFLKYCSEKGKVMMLSEVIDPLFLRAYLMRVANENTRNKRSSFLRSFLRTICTRDVLQGLIDLKTLLPITLVNNKEPRAFSMEQIQEMLGYCKEGPNNFRNYTMIWTLIGSGIRVQQLMRLQVGDVIPETQDVYVIPQKKRTLTNDKERRKIGLQPLRILNSYIEFTYGHLKNDPKYKVKYIFSKDDGKSCLHVRTIQTIVDDLINRCKTITDEVKKKLSTHSFRHSFAIAALEAGISIYVISELLGHAYLKSTEFYLNLFDKHLQEAIESHPYSDLDLDNLIWEDSNARR